LMLKKWYMEQPVFVTTRAFDQGQIMKRLAIAREVAKATTDGNGLGLSWPLQRMMDRLKVGDDASPLGLNPLQLKGALAKFVRTSEEYRELGAFALSSLNERGYLLTLQSESGPGRDVARNALRRMGFSS